jgi:hypothetical protein
VAPGLGRDFPGLVGRRGKVGEVTAPYHRPSKMSSDLALDSVAP